MANKHSITEFINSFGGGTRINRFRITGNLGEKTSLTDKGGTFLIRTASLPPSTVGAIPINYRGRTVIYPGDRAYAPWQITVLDENPKESKTGKTLYRAFHDWSNQINNHVLNTTTQTNPSDHFSNSTRSGGTVWTVEQLETNGANAIRKFTLHNCWPVAIGELTLDMSQDNVLGSFGVTIAYSHYEFSTTNNS